MPTGSGRRVWPALLLTLGLLPIPALAGASAQPATSGSPRGGRALAVEPPAPATAAPRSSEATALEQQAWQLFLQGSAEARGRALERLAGARRLLLRPVDEPGLARLWRMEGLILFALARYRDSNRAYGEALRLQERLGRPSDQADLRLSLAMGHLNLGEYDQARRQLALVTAAGRRSNETRLLIQALELESQLDARSGQPQAAIRRLEQALALAGNAGANPSGRSSTSSSSAGGSREQQIRLLDAMAMVHLPLGQLAEVRRVLERRRALAPTETSLAETVLASLESRSRPEELGSPEQLAAQIRRFRAAGDVINTATSLESLGTVELNRGRLRRGLALYLEALALYERRGMRGRAASALRNVGQVHATLGDYGRSLEVTGRALELARSIGEPRVETQCLLDLADLQQTLGSLDLAATSLEAALSLASRQRDHFRRAQALNGLADLRRRQQRLAEAAGLARRALAVGADSRMPLLQAAALSTLVRARESLGELEPAMQAAQQIETLGSDSGDRWISAMGRALRGRVLLAMGQPAAALAALEVGIEVFRSQQQLAALSANLELKARALTALGRLEPAMAVYREAAQLCSAMGDPACEATVLFEQSRLSARQQRLEEALLLIRRSLVISEGLRANLPAADLRQSQFALLQDRYDWWIELLLQLQRRQPQRRHDLEALAVSERARARGLVELLSSARAEVVSGVDPALLARRRRLDGRLRELMLARLRLRQSGGSAAGRAAALADLEIRLAVLQRQQGQLEEQLRHVSPRYAALLLPRPLDATAIQALPEDDTLLLEYHLTETGGVLWLISRQGVESHPLPARREIQRLVAAFHAELRRGDGPTAASPAAHSLTRLLLQPVAARLPGKRLAIVPHASLFYLPFAALPAPGGEQPLLVSHELITLPSASTLAILRETPAARATQTATQAATARAARAAAAPSMLVLADPVFGPDDPRLPAGATPPAAGDGPEPADRNWRRLPGTAREAAAISALLGGGGQRREGFAASRSALLGADLTAYPILHIATHGSVDGRQPERSRLLLSLYGPDGRPIDGALRLQDIYNLRLAADLVVLSACQSGLGGLVRGEGLVGLTRGFLHAGARRVLASLWDVDDTSTAVLMQRFYRGLLQEKLPPAAALRRAQLALLSDPRWRSAHFWAPFVLQGDWR
ncbi:MAG: CHAT domain-containing protein [Synechococcus sp.]|nr:CHAT domain-containing protein [Synechococcus sp.]